MTPLIGRESELAAIHTFLRGSAASDARGGRSRLVTLTGPGGVGKSRLALHLAADLDASHGFADGVAFVELAAVRDPDQVVPAIAQALGVRGAVEESADTALAAYLRGKHLLLVLDNFEQVHGAGPNVTDLLRAHPDLTVIVTSRTVLNVYGEQVMPVPPLSLPGPGMQRLPGESAAVRLFVQRLQAVQPGFELSEANAGTVAEIVRRLDGLPLAIELAAARGAMFTPRALLARLEQRLVQLTGGPRDRPERHQTMRAAIAWSYDLLSSEEQRIFRSLGTFVGGFNLEAADAVGGSGGGSASSPLVSETIESLLRHSLIRVVEPHANGEENASPRFSMLETVREFAVEQLALSGETEPGQRHAEYFLALADRSEPTYWGDTPGDWRSEIGLEEGNLEAALIWATDNGQADLALRFACARFDRHFDSFFRASADRSVRAHRQWVQRALALPGGSPVNRVRGLIAAAWLAFSQDEHDEGWALAIEALERAKIYGSELDIANASFVLGVAAQYLGDVGAARPYFDAALIGYQAMDTPGRRAWTLLHLAHFYCRDAIDEGGSEEDLAIAANFYEDALAHFRTVDHAHGTSRALHGRAYVAYKQRDLPRALILTQEVLALDWNQGWPVYYYLEDIADIAGRLGQPEIAARLYGAADGLRDRAKQPLAPLFQDEFERDAAVARRALGETGFTDAWEDGRTRPDDEIVAEALALTTEPRDRSNVSLTARQIQVLELLATGMSDAAIAEAPFLSVRTVEHHVGHLLAKLGVRSRADAVAAAQMAHLIPRSSKSPLTRLD